jgi:hypothetical protein
VIAIRAYSKQCGQSTEQLCDDRAGYLSSSAILHRF